LRDLIKNPHRASDAEATTFLREAETLIDSAAPPPPEKQLQ
jgi:hypothetical protein